MSTCGYICPQCEGKGYSEDGEICNWCQPDESVSGKTDEEWIAAVHEGCGCSDQENA
jgi:hypothetical protein